MDTAKGFWNETDFIKAYEEATGAKLNEESLFFWKLFGYVKFAAASLGAFRTGLESKDLEIYNLGIFSRLLPLMLQRTAQFLEQQVTPRLPIRSLMRKAMMGHISPWPPLWQELRGGQLWIHASV